MHHAWTRLLECNSSLYNVTVLQNKYKKVYDDNYKEYKSKMDEFYGRYPDAKELFKRYVFIHMYVCLCVCHIVVLYYTVKKAHKERGMCTTVLVTIISTLYLPY